VRPAGIPKYQAISRLPVPIPHTKSQDELAYSAAVVSGLHARGTSPVAEAAWGVEIPQTAVGEHERAWGAGNILDATLSHSLGHRGQRTISISWCAVWPNGILEPAFFHDRAKRLSGFVCPSLWNESPSSRSPSCQGQPPFGSSRFTAFFFSPEAFFRSVAPCTSGVPLPPSGIVYSRLKLSLEAAVRHHHQWLL